MSIRIDRWSVPALCLAAATVAVLSVAVVAQERDRAKIPDKYKWNLAEIYPNEAAWRAAKDKLAAELPQLRQFEGQARLVGVDAGRCAGQAVRARQGTLPPVRVREHAGRSGHARREAPGHEAGDGAARRRSSARRRRSSNRNCSEPARRRSSASSASEPRLEDLSLLHRRRRPPGGAHAHRQRGKDSRRSRTAGRRTLGDLQHPGERRFPVPVGDAQRRPFRQGSIRQPTTDLRMLPNRADREKVMSAFFQALGGFSRTFGTTMNGEVQKVQFFAKARKYPSALTLALDGPNIPVVGVHEPGRWREPQPAGLSPLSEAAQADARRRPAALLRPVRAAGRIGEARLHARGSAEARARRGRAAGRASIRRPSQRAFNDRWIDLTAERRQALGRLFQRRRVRRPSVHADQLQRKVHRRQHAGARARAHDAELSLEQDASRTRSRPIRSSSRRWRPRSTSRC